MQVQEEAKETKRVSTNYKIQFKFPPHHHPFNQDTLIGPKGGRIQRESTVYYISTKKALFHGENLETNFGERESVTALFGFWLFLMWSYHIPLSAMR